MSTPRRKPRVLVIGPATEPGGMGVVARMTADAEHLPDWGIRVVDTAKTTPAGRSTRQAVGAHLRRFARLLAALIRHRPHVAHVHTCSYNTFFRTMPDILACRLLGTRVALHIHGGFFAEFIESLNPLTRRAVRFHLRRCHRVVVIGDVWRTRLAELVPGLACDSIPNAVDTTAPPLPCTHRSGNRIVFVGDLARSKGTDDLVEALALLPEPLRNTVQLRFVGGGGPGRREQLFQLARRQGVADRLQFTGPLPRDNVRHEYSQADIFCLPSHGEAMPIVLLEAMTAQLPSVATDVGVVREVLREGVDGYVVPPHDTGILSARLQALLTSPGLRATMGQHAAARVSAAFGLESFYDRINRLWHSLISPSSSLATSPQSDARNSSTSPA